MKRAALPFALIVCLAARSAFATPEDTEEPRDKRSAPETRVRKSALLELSGGMQGFSRSFEYHQDVDSALHPYHLPFWPALEARVGYCPGAHFTNDMAANFGVVFGVSRSLGATSEIASSGNYGTTMQEITAGARFRLPIARHELGASLLYGNHQFSIDSDHEPIVGGFEAARYVLDMHTTLADRAAARELAGGAVDQYLTGHLGVEFRLGEASTSD